LDSKNRGLAEAFRNAAAEQRRRATLVACEMVVPLIGLDTQSDVKAALRALQERRDDEPALRSRLSALSLSFDDEYFRLQEEGDETKRSDVLRLFAKARATSALVLALTEDASQLHEAIYEALSALTDDPGEVVRAVGLALGASVPT
jgi:hypothetical protein